MNAPKYLIWSEEHGAWWRPGRWGYTQQMREAGIYSLAEAGEIMSGANLFGKFKECAIPAPAWLLEQRAPEPPT